MQTKIRRNVLRDSAMQIDGGGYGTSCYHDHRVLSAF